MESFEAYRENLDRLLKELADVNILLGAIGYLDAQGLTAQTFADTLAARIAGANVIRLQPVNPTPGRALPPVQALISEMIAVANNMPNVTTVLFKAAAVDKVIERRDELEKQIKDASRAPNKH